MMPPVSNFDYLVVALREGRGGSCEGDWQGKGVLQYRRIVCPQCLPAGIESTLPTMPEIWSYPRARSPRVCIPTFGKRLWQGRMVPGQHLWVRF